MKNILKKWAERLKKDERGMTLVELLAVVVILGIIGGIAFVSIGNVIENSKKDAHVANAQQIISAAELHLASTGSLPGVDSTSSTVIIENLDTLNKDDLVDPWREATDYAGYGGKFTLTYDDTDNTFEIAYTEGTAFDANAKCDFKANSRSDLAKAGKDACGK